MVVEKKGKQAEKERNIGDITPRQIRKAKGQMDWLDLLIVYPRQSYILAGRLQWQV